MKPRELFFLLLLTLAALLVHGYHPWAEDAEIYLPGVEKILDPHLFPVNAQFFEAHAKSTLFPNLIAESVRLSHLPLDVVLFAWHVASVFLFLLACWQLSSRCFSSARARWAAVALVASLLTIPIAGTALYILDQYLNPRSFSAFLSVFAIVKALDKKYWQAGLILIVTFAIHPLMSVFTFSYCILLIGWQKFDRRFVSFASVLPFGITFAPPPKSYHLVALAHPLHYITRWHWYEWLGVVAPLPILWCFSRIAKSRRTATLDLLCLTLIVYELLYIPPAIVFSVVPRFEALARLAPVRSLFLVYVLMFLFAGGLLGEYVLKNCPWRWGILFVPLCVSMFYAQLTLFPASAHIEWPGIEPKNEWVQAFQWVRDHTPTDAFFALNPRYMDLSGEDEQGFRAIAQRSQLADSVKDSGAVSMFPVMADEWLRQVEAQSGWEHFQLIDFERLKAAYGVNWIVVEQPNVTGLECPYRNSTVKVCRLP